MSSKIYFETMATIWTMHRESRNQNHPWTWWLDNMKKYIIFTYHDRAVSMITKLFRNIELKIAYKTTNTLKNHLQTNKKTTNKYEL
jgi:hypothetical protein